MFKPKKKTILLIGVALTLFVLMGGMSFTTYATEKTTITFYFGPIERQLALHFSPFLEPYLNANPNVKVEWMCFPWAGFHEKIATSIMGGNPPDICWGASGSAVRKYVVMEGLYPLTNWMKEIGLDFQKVYSKSIAENSMVDGQIYNLPWGADVLLLGFNKETFVKAGLATKETRVWDDLAPKTWEEQLNLCRKLTKDIDGDGKFDTFGSSTFGGRLASHQLIPLIWQAGGEIDGVEDGEIKIVLGRYRKEFIEALKYMKELAEYTPGGAKAAASRSYDQVMAQFAWGEIGLFPQCNYWISYHLLELNPNMDQGWWLQPKGKVNVARNHDSGWFVFQEGKADKKEVLKLLEWMNAEENIVKGTFAFSQTPLRTDIVATRADLLSGGLPIEAYQVGMEQVKSARIPPIHPAWLEMREEMFKAAAAVMLGESAEKVADDTIAALERIDKEWRMK